MSEHTGGMIAWVPRAQDADRLTVIDANAEPAEELHVTIAYLGDDVTDVGAQQVREWAQAVWAVAGEMGPQTVRVFGHAVFNPDGDEPCAVYLVGDNDILTDVRAELADVTTQKQHSPYIPHITVGYGVPAGLLSYTGEIVLDRLRLAIAGDVVDFPLSGKNESKGSIVDDLETKREISQSKRDKLAKTDKATNDGTHVIESVKDLQNAISAYGRASEEDKEKLRAHIVRNAKRLKATNMLPKNWSETPASEKKSTWRDARDPLTAGILMGLSGLDEDEALEMKAGPPGATFASPDPGATKLRQYWTKGPGAAKIGWGKPGDFDNCVREMRKHVGKRAEGLCNIYHRTATGAAPGKGHGKKDAEDGIETKGTTLWMPDPESKAGYRAVSTAWMHVADSNLAAEIAAPVEVKETAVAETPAETAPAQSVEDSLDKFEAMAETITTEQVYEEALVNDVEWEMDGSGNLTPEPQDEDSPHQAEPGELDDAVAETAEADDGAAEAEAGDDWGSLDASEQDAETSEDEEERVPRAAPDLF